MTRAGRLGRLAGALLLGAGCASAPKTSAPAPPAEPAAAELASPAAPPSPPDAAGLPAATPGRDFETLRVLAPVPDRADGPLVAQHYGTNPTVDTAAAPVSTFSVDVDTASYTMTRAWLRGGALPDPRAVRVEEFINSFRYDYPAPRVVDGAPVEPFSVVAEAFPSPQRKGYHVLLLGLKGRVLEEDRRPAANLVFVVDVSGSMEGGRLQMVKDALGVLVDRLREDDAVSVVVYGSTARVVLPPTSGADRPRILAALATLQPEGSTNVQAGLLLGYEVARQRSAGRVTRLLLCSDGVANSGVTDADGIFATIDEHARAGMALTTVGVGMGGYNDVLMEQLAVRGQGRYVYVERLAEARKVFAENLGGAIVNIASDVKIQVELDASAVERYRLLGYENRQLQQHQFADDRVDAGEIGAGHEVTALYEVKLRPGADRIGWLRVRAKAPGQTQSRLIEEELTTGLVRRALAETSATSRLSLVAAAFAEKLRGSYWVRNLSWAALQAQWRDLPAELRQRPEVAELGDLIAVAAALDRRGDPFERELPVAQMDFDHLPVTTRNR